MHKYIVTNTMNELRINVEVQYASKAVAANISPIKLESGKIDQSALAEYEEFLVNVLAVLDENEYEVIDIEKSSKSKTSYYITSCKKSESSADNIKCIIFIRISDHSLSEKTKKLRKDYYEGQPERYAIDFI